MDSVLLTFYCAVPDADKIIETLRAKVKHPLHIHAETVHGLDFSDANVVEQVTGTLQRSAVSLVTSRMDADVLVAQVNSLQRGHAVRWCMVPVVSHGRLP